MRASDIEPVIAPVVAALGLEVDRVETAAAGKRTVLRVYLDGDGPEGRGPSLDDIADATRAISIALDDSPATGNAPYLLEVSSRGVGRPLTDPKHYRRNTGRLITASQQEGGSLTGRILATDADGVRLDVEGTERTLPYDQIGKAVVQVELNRLPDATEDEADAADDEEE